MARRRRATKRTTIGDSRYGSPMVTRLINTVMRCGKKSIAEGIVYTAIENVTRAATPWIHSTC